MAIKEKHLLMAMFAGLQGCSMGLAACLALDGVRIFANILDLLRAKTELSFPDTLLSLDETGVCR